MSLDFDISEVENHEEVKVCHEWADENTTEEQIRESWKTQAIVFLTMAIGMGSITESNHREFATRIIMWEDVNSSYLRLGGEAYRLTYQDVHRRIGLFTNVTEKTKAQFAKTIAQDLRNVVEHQVSYEKPSKQPAAA